MSTDNLVIITIGCVLITGILSLHSCEVEKLAYDCVKKPAVVQPR